MRQSCSTLKFALYEKKISYLAVVDTQSAIWHEFGGYQDFKTCEKYQGKISLMMGHEDAKFRHLVKIFRRKKHKYLSKSTPTMKTLRDDRLRI